MDALEAICDSVKTAATEGQALFVRGGDSKRFIGRPTDASRELDVREHSGLIEYHPEELVVRVRGGTHLDELNSELDARNQMLAFEPPDFDGGATIGGAVAAGLSGSRRPYAGAVKDHVLGMGLVTGEGNYLEFGGQVMKNVAGYDVSRLACGSFGMLGVIADISVKVLPKPTTEVTVKKDMPVEDAMTTFSRLVRKASTLSAACFYDGCLYVRFSGSEEAVRGQASEIGGEAIDSAFWQTLDNQRYKKAVQAKEIWRLSTIPGETVERDYALIDWGGAQRWLLDPESSPRRGYTGKGYWTLFRSEDSARDEVFQPLSGTEMMLHQKLKDVFDPKRILNPGRMYANL